MRLLFAAFFYIVNGQKNLCSIFTFNPFCVGCSESSVSWRKAFWIFDFSAVEKPKLFSFHTGLWSSYSPRIYAWLVVQKLFSFPNIQSMFRTHANLPAITSAFLCLPHVWSEKNRPARGSLRGSNKHLAGVVVTHRGEVSISFVASQRTTFQNFV